MFKDPPFEGLKDSWFMNLLKKKKPGKPQLIECARSMGRTTDMLMRYIASVQRGEKAIVIGTKYVVMSREMYDEIVRKQK